MTRYYSLNRYLKETYGEKVYKLALKGGFTCPNRDGTAGYGGCVFCGEGSGSFASETLDEAIELLSRTKRIGHRFIAYFQSFTSTYRLTEELKQRILQAAEDERIAAVAIASRPDCLQDYVMQFLLQVQKIKPVWVELGLQTIHPETAERIHRGYELPVFTQAVDQLHRAGMDVVVHLILGLPGETRKEMLESVAFLNTLPIRGVKLQLLHVLRNTPLGESGYQSDMSLEQYADLVCDCISLLREDIVIHRITGDAPKKDLLSPLWSADKKKVLNTIRKRLEERDILQGKEL